MHTTILTRFIIMIFFFFNSQLLQCMTYHSRKLKYSCYQISILKKIITVRSSNRNSPNRIRKPVNLIIKLIRLKKNRKKFLIMTFEIEKKNLKDELFLVFLEERPNTHPWRSVRFKNGSLTSKLT